MPTRFQAAALAAAPCYPNAIAWSDENLIAVASGHLVTILNPALPFRPRGLISIPTCEPYSIGVVNREDLRSGCLLPTCLNRDRRPCVRSISWSPLGMAPNGGCLLAVCTTEGRVKIYHPPFCDFVAEWIEVMDISDRLYYYLAAINFGESNISSAKFSEENAPEHQSVNDTANVVLRREHKQRRVSKGFKSGDDPDLGSSLSTEEARVLSASEYKGKPANKVLESCSLPIITAEQYISRSAVLHSLSVAWSPMLKLSSQNCPVLENGSSNWFSVLAVGGRSGKISFWRICIPECYSVEHSNNTTTPLFIGLLQAHNTWVTTISWALLSSDPSNPRVSLVTGSSNGSVRIWAGHGQDLLKSAETSHVQFSLVREVITVDTAPISVVSLIVPVQAPKLMLLAVGKGSGSFELWMFDIMSSKLDKAGSYDAHDQVVTGLTWAFGGSCLYSCSQDNFVRSWILRGNSLFEVPIPPSTIGLKSSTDLPDAFVSCLGVAVSPGNLVLAMVRIMDLDALDTMYEARAQKAAIEFFWIGGQQLDFLSKTIQKYGLKPFPAFSEGELSRWESNFLWTLKQYEDVNKPLVVWDVVAALSVFKQSIPKYVECTLVKWLSSLCLGSHVGLSTKKVLSHVSKSISSIASRRLHLVNIFCRCLALSELTADQINSKVQNLGGTCGSEEEQLTMWLELLLNSERELRERLVGFSFSAFISLTSHLTSPCSQPGHWCPDGLAQMEQWVAQNHEYVQDHLRDLASGVRQEWRKHSSKYVEEEQCNCCVASVPFDSAEVAFCRGLQSSDGVHQKHKLVRCAVSMRVCPVTPLWFCKCCQRWTSKLAPESFFTMRRFPDDFKTLKDPSIQEEFSKPMCPFCGILLQRIQPDFLLSASPV